MLSSIHELNLATLEYPSGKPSSQPMEAPNEVTPANSPLEFTNGPPESP